LKADPQPARAGLAVRNAFEPAAEQRSHDTEHVFGAVEADAADEMDGCGRVIGHARSGLADKHHRVRNAAVKAALARFGRVGEPVYVN
jgi:hypothetical protein